MLPVRQSLPNTYTTSVVAAVHFINIHLYCANLCLLIPITTRFATRLTTCRPACRSTRSSSPLPSTFYLPDHHRRPAPQVNIQPQVGPLLCNAPAEKRYITKNYEAFPNIFRKISIMVATIIFLCLKYCLTFRLRFLLSFIKPIFFF